MIKHIKRIHEIMNATRWVEKTLEAKTYHVGDYEKTIRIISKIENTIKGIFCRKAN